MYAGDDDSKLTHQPQPSAPEFPISGCLVELVVSSYSAKVLALGVISEISNSLFDDWFV